MYIKIHSKYDNTGSCEDLVNYLEKENEGVELSEKEFFFSQDHSQVNADYARVMIDNNHKKLGKADSKFFMLTINPSTDEVAHLSGDKQQLKEYTKAVMEEYAKQFNRRLDGKPLTGDDLLWFAKVEVNRSYAAGDAKHYEAYQINSIIASQIRKMQIQLLETKQETQKKLLAKKITEFDKEYLRDSAGTVILPHKQKDGLNMHVHVIVSRKDKSGRLKLSPLSNSKGSQNSLNGKKVGIGFHRKAFVEQCEKIFDKQFFYERDFDKSFKYYHARKHDAAKFFHFCQMMTMDPKLIAKKEILQALGNDPTLAKVLYFPKNSQALQRKIENKIIDEAGKLLVRTAGYQPLSFPHTLITKALHQAVNLARAHMMGVEI